MSQKNNSLSRRNFLKTTITGGAAAAASTLPSLSYAAPRRQKTQLTFAWPFGSGLQAAQEVTSQFNAQSDTIEVEFQEIPFSQVLPALTTAYSGGVGPDVVMISPAWITQFSAAGWLENLDPWLESSGLEETLLPISMIQGRMYQNTGYMVGAIVDTFIMYYNPEHFAEAGIESFPTTTQEFADVAVQLTDPASGRYGYYLYGSGPTAFQPWAMWMVAHGGLGVDNTLYTEDGTCIFRGVDHITGLKDFLALYKDLQVSPPASATAASADATNAFSAGQASIMNGFLGGISQLNTNMGEGLFGTAMLPAGPAGQFVHWAANGLAMNANSANKEATWEFIEFLMSPEINTAYNQSWGAIPAVEAALDAEYLQEPIFEAPLAQVQMPEAFIVTPRELPSWGDFFTNYQPEQLQRALLGDITAEEFAENVSDRLEEIRAEEL